MFGFSYILIPFILSFVVINNEGSGTVAVRQKAATTRSPYVQKNQRVKRLDDETGHS